MFNVSVRKIVVSTVAIAAPVAFSFGASSEAWGGATHNWEKNTGTHAAKTPQLGKDFHRRCQDPQLGKDCHRRWQDPQLGADDQLGVTPPCHVTPAAHRGWRNDTL